AKTLAAGQTGTVQATGTLSVSGSTVAVTVTGNGATLTNSGTIKQTGTGRAIRDNTGISFTLVNNANATIQTAADDVIQLNKAASSILFDNFGTLNALGGGQALDFNAVTTGSTTVHNHDTGLIQAFNADAFRAAAGGLITNDGTIKSVGTDSG